MNALRATSSRLHSVAGKYKAAEVNGVDRTSPVTYVSHFFMGVPRCQPHRLQAWRTCPLWEPSPSHPIYCRLGDLLCLFCVYHFCVYFSLCILLFSLFDLSFVAFPSVLWYCWLGLLTCKNRLPYNLYCVGGDVKHCSVQSMENSQCMVCGCVWTIRSVCSDASQYHLILMSRLWR